MTTETTNPPFEGWAILEILGHRTRPGYVKEVEMFGGKLIRVDIPVKDGDVEGHVTEYYGCPSIYSMRPATEEVVKQAAFREYGGIDPRPVKPLDYKPRPALEVDRDAFAGQDEDGD